MNLKLIRSALTLTFATGLLVAGCGASEGGPDEPFEEAEGAVSIRDCGKVTCPGPNCGTVNIGAPGQCSFSFWGVTSPNASYGEPNCELYYVASETNSSTPVTAFVEWADAEPTQSQCAKSYMYLNVLRSVSGGPWQTVGSEIRYDCQWIFGAPTFVQVRGPQSMLDNPANTRLRAVGGAHFREPGVNVFTKKRVRVGFKNGEGPC